MELQMQAHNTDKCWSSLYYLYVCMYERWQVEEPVFDTLSNSIHQLTPENGCDYNREQTSSIDGKVEYGKECSQEISLLRTGAAQ